MKATEANFDGLPGLTHHYAGLSFGNEASTRNQFQLSNPRLAAKQGLMKMKALADMGFVQGVIPPHQRPDMAALRQLGFSGSDARVLQDVVKKAPGLLSAVSSASAMWVANAATVAPSADTLDGRVHFTVANLNNKFHRAIEATTTSSLLGAIFRDADHFAVHDALPQVAMFGDEGAANHNRFGAGYGSAGVQLFIYGRDESHPERGPQRYPARQTRQASEAVARLNQLVPGCAIYAQQNPAAIDQGVFHNDVIAVSNQQVLFCHQQAFVDQPALYRSLAEKIPGFTPVEVPASRISIADCVQTYLFNSQLLTRPDDNMLLVLPEEARRHEGVWRWLNELTEQQGPIRELRAFDLRESMCNGGGPACLRLRVVLTPQEQAKVNPAVLMNETLFATLDQWVERHYRDRLSQQDLADPQLLDEGRVALDELTKLLDLGNVYNFQQ
ncbi:N-succinylarginine dihydrolase [Izhakiella australiensis]|uniref:N-succinylarginine dihydrolase n=1 Tax=Izhakiella australiensis TaxID=1926881 RepID=A0A1S8YR68_9GAMM|nr:N-succinylarginine dihydrolase [Izhakiella australiensis]OON41277.1 N-succinylarginine dihydrolase [Izhakiella australiensis]